MTDTLKVTMLTLQDDLQNKLPALLVAEGVPGITYYTVGNPENQEDTWCCVRLAALKGKESMEVIIHLSLPRVSELDAYAYIQALLNYLENVFDPNDYGYETEDPEFQIFETDFTHGDIQTLCSVTLTRILDDCD